MSTYWVNNPGLCLCREPRAGSIQTNTNRMKATRILITASATLLVAAQAGAQPQGAPPHPPHGDRPPPPIPAIFAVLDTNHDGKISANEMTGTTTAFKKLDKDGDGFISPQEAQGAPPADGRHHGRGTPPPPPKDKADGPPPTDGQAGPPPPPVPAIFAVLDTNHDGKISTDEWAAAKEALAKLDQNGDGFISIQEAQGPPPADAPPPPSDEDGADAPPADAPPADAPPADAPPAEAPAAE